MISAVFVIALAHLLAAKLVTFLAAINRPREDGALSTYLQWLTVTHI